MLWMEHGLPEHRLWKEAENVNNIYNDDVSHDGQCNDEYCDCVFNAKNEMVLSI